MTHTTPLIQYLNQHGLIDAQLAQQLLESDVDHAGLTEELVSNNIMSRNEIEKLESLFSGIPAFEGSLSAVDPSVQSLLPLQQSQKHRVVCVSQNGRNVCLVTDNNVLSQIPVLLGGTQYQSEIFRVDSGKIDQLLENYQTNTERSLLESIERTATRVRRMEGYGSQGMAMFFPSDHKREVAEDLSSHKLLKRLVELGTIKGASLVTLQVMTDKISVRLKIKEETVEILTLPLEVGPSVYLALRYMCDLPLEECSEIQQSRTNLLDMHTDGQALNVTFTPTVTGVSMDINLTHVDPVYASLAELGLLTQDKDTLYEWMQTRCGTILITGRTASGKTYASYQLLQALQHRYSVATIEESIEYVVDGVTQTVPTKRVEKDLQVLGSTRDVVALLPMVQSVALAAANMAHNRIIVTESPSGVMGVVKSMLSAGLSRNVISQVLNYNIVAQSFNSLDKTQTYSYKLNADDIATIEQYVSVREVSMLLQNHRIVNKEITQLSDTSWDVPIDDVTSWKPWKAWTHKPNKEEQTKHHTRALVDLSRIIDMADQKNRSLIELEKEIKEAQKTALLRTAIVHAARSDISIIDVVAMLRA